MVLYLEVEDLSGRKINVKDLGLLDRATIICKAKELIKVLEDLDKKK